MTNPQHPDSLTNEEIVELLGLDEKKRRRERTEQGRSPAQQTTKSDNKARIKKRPGKGHRHDWEKEITE